MIGFGDTDWWDQALFEWRKKPAKTEIVAALRYELGDNHSYEYVDGMIPAEIAPEIESLYPATDQYHSYFNDETKTCIQALSDLSQYIEIEGPFDGVIGFSTGASLAATLLLQDSKASLLGGCPDPPFKVAVFFSGVLPADPEILKEKGMRKFVETAEGPLISIPTAHIWGCNDREWSDSSKKLAQLCSHHGRNIFVHDGSHEIPGSRDKSAILGAVHAIRRTIEAALMAQ